MHPNTFVAYMLLQKGEIFVFSFLNVLLCATGRWIIYRDNGVLELTLFFVGKVE